MPDGVQHTQNQAGRQRRTSDQQPRQGKTAKTRLFTQRDEEHDEDEFEDEIFTGHELGCSRHRRAGDDVQPQRCQPQRHRQQQGNGVPLDAHAPADDSTEVGLRSLPSVGQHGNQRAADERPPDHEAPQRRRIQAAHIPADERRCPGDRPENHLGIALEKRGGRTHGILLCPNRN